jgi:hypothetical protein
MGKITGGAARIQSDDGCSLSLGAAQSAEQIDLDTDADFIAILSRMP